ncbi:MAG: NifB/NifX family molybdenum-iron cluster-binding protein [Methanocellales archaeon]|nr:NifB/NifX family molybdenum-iron cluster-binding protein [Methanocellales archaeon]
MKVCVPTMGQSGMNDMISPHFGRAPTFTIVDTETNEIEVLPNTGEHMGGIMLAPEIIAEAGVHVILCSGLGPRAIHMFEQFGIEVFVGASGTVKDAIGAWKSGRLQEATDETACREHRH